MTCLNGGRSEKVEAESQSEVRHESAQEGEREGETVYLHCGVKKKKQLNM